MAGTLWFSCQEIARPLNRRHVGIICLITCTDKWTNVALPHVFQLLQLTISKMIKLLLDGLDCFNGALHNVPCLNWEKEKQNQSFVSLEDVDLVTKKGGPHPKAQLSFGLVGRPVCLGLLGDIFTLLFCFFGLFYIFLYLLEIESR